MGYGGFWKKQYLDQITRKRKEWDVQREKSLRPKGEKTKKFKVRPLAELVN